jgi:hypothetical protein
MDRQHSGNEEDVRQKIHQSMALVAVVVLMTAIACRDDTTSATPFGGVFTGSPTAAPGLQDMPEQLDVTVSGGEFDVREIRVIVDVPTMMRVTNEDAQDYVLRIGNLVTETPLPAGETVEVNFTTPTADTYEAELLDGPDGDQLDRAVLVVRQPGGGTP